MTGGVLHVHLVLYVPVTLMLVGVTDFVRGCTDTPGMVLNTHTCQSLIGNFSTYCYSHLGGDYNTTCCASCLKAKTCDENCLYGDKKLDCADCISPFNKLFCCSTCPSPTSVTCITTTTTTATTTTTERTTTTPLTTTQTTTTTPTTTTQTTLSETTSSAAPPSTTTTTTTTGTTAQTTSTATSETTTTTAYTSTSTPTPALPVGDSDTLLTFSDSASIGMYAAIGGLGVVGLTLSSIAIVVYLKRPKRTNSQVGVALTNNWVG